MSGFLNADNGSTGLNLNVSGETINSAESTSSTSYTNLITSGPTATVTVGASGKLLITLSCAISRVSGSLSSGFASISMSGTNVLPANDQNSVEYNPPSNNAFGSVSRTILLEGLSPGSTSIAMKYRSSDAGSQFQFKNKSLTVVPI
jgi:hypothetical protein